MTTRLTTFNLPSLQRQLIGFDELFKVLDQQSGGRFPVMNILSSGTNKFRIEMALAGYNKEDLQVITNGNRLTVRTVDNYANQSAPDGWEYLTKEISTRAFSKDFQLADFLEVSGVTFDNGVLQIDLDLNLPEAMKPKVFQIK